MPSSLTTQLAGHSWELYADRGLYWPSKRILFVADTHFGKEATFRRHGVPVPVGSTEATLSAIRRMLDHTQAERLVILGDMFHARSSLSPDVIESLDQFFHESNDVTFTLIRGNHDARLGQLPATWPLEVIEPTMHIDRIALGHYPMPLPKSADLYLCGHLHPAIRLGSRADSLGKLPCFWLSDGCFVLPAIGDFTGTHQIEPKPSDQAWLIGEGEIHAHRFAKACDPPENAKTKQNKP